MKHVILTPNPYRDKHFATLREAIAVLKNAAVLNLTNYVLLCCFLNDHGDLSGSLDVGSVVLTNIVTLNGGTFTGNTAKNGGVAYSLKGNLIVNPCEINNNSATGNGGAIYVANNSLLNIISSGVSAVKS